MQKTSTKKDGVEACIKDHCLWRGHKSKDCPAKVYPTRGCGKPGHLFRACLTPGGGKGSRAKEEQELLEDEVAPEERGELDQRWRQTERLQVNCQLQHGEDG